LLLLKSSRYSLRVLSLRPEKFSHCLISCACSESLNSYHSFLPQLLRTSGNVNF
jgi:hypothetical protein